MSRYRELLSHFCLQLDNSIALLRRLVELESNSLDKPGIDALADFVASEFRTVGARVEILQHATSGSALEVLWCGTGNRLPMLVLGHLDTVWPLGTIHSRPFRIEDGRAYGPGVFDMKAGILMCLLLGQALRDRWIVPSRDVRFFFSGDEEIGTEGCLSQLRRSAQGCCAVLCLEPPLPGGKAKTFRKGVATFRLRVKGIASHAGVDPEKGASAVLELSRLVIELHKMTDHSRGITVNVGTFRGGMASNIIPAAAEADVDVRYSRAPDGWWAEERIRGLRPLDTRCTLSIEDGPNRPPLERTEAVVALYHRARAVAAELGMELGEGPTGGGSDGSFTAAMGIPTLDGLGVAGDGAHALHEHVEVSDIPRRCALLCGLVDSV